MGDNVKLGIRLQQIRAMAGGGYDHVWDGCCDHGYLGISLLTQPGMGQVHFVDVVPELINDLDARLAQHPCSHWHTHCMDVAELPLAANPGRHLVILAGIGGDLVIDIVNRLHQRHPTAEIDYLLCPVYHTFAVRERLIQLDFHLHAEALVQERRHCYEILKVSPLSHRSRHLPKVSPAGDSIWQTETPEQARIAQHYLQRTLNHYRRVQQGNLKDVKEAVAAYEAIEPNPAMAANVDSFKNL
ncbi:tRNA (adenine(22)-N(1))-methyltransferase TrmK [Marinobacterium weihaiense]|uniref:tRNA (Adenine(22)-N(1))-methyltransferase TrmK n=1 Tax=Marinobacterium weihaiense TaxID=2851016 RepID=A0ABS6MBH0_9GAMM|nr:tRNA (adenine(22)-N(1))-methyltransferase TrmK [Marinobacterium weihaiense]MBV0933620.1 tRNA (adenine(22)-N(1))-methyltransferase TrmK [Marinobacterium weihaiense]